MHPSVSERADVKYTQHRKALLSRYKRGRGKKKGHSLGRYLRSSVPQNPPAVTNGMTPIPSRVARAGARGGRAT
jgi:hypothetical protein